MTLESYMRALRPKVHGSRNLHKLLSRNSLDFFIMLSSCAGLLGNNGQGNYASACTFQDAFARYRAGLGLHTRSLDLGMIQSAGYVSENFESMRYLADVGWGYVKLDEFFAFLDHAITTPVPDFHSSQTIIGIPDINKFSGRDVPSQMLDPRLSHVISRGSRHHGADTGGTEEANLHKALCSVGSLAEARDLIAHAIVAKVAKVLVLPVEDVSALQPISSYGADSLVAVELRNWFVRRLEAETTIIDILSAKPILELAADVAAKSRLVDAGLK